MPDLNKEELYQIAILLPRILPMDRIVGFTLWVYFPDGKSQSLSTLDTEDLARVMDEHLKDMHSGNINDLGGIQIGE